MKRVLWIFLFMALVIVPIFSVGCEKEVGNEIEERVFAEVVDQMGRDVVISTSPERVISLSPSNTEIVFAIGLGGNIVGVTDYCNYPEEALEKEKVGGFSSPNLETILSLEPDLVLAGNMHEEQVQKLEEMDIPVLVLAPESVEEVFEAIKLVAEATGQEEEAEVVISNIKNRLEAVQEKLDLLPKENRVRVYYEVYSDPIMTAGGSSLISEVIYLAGGKNIFVDVKEKFPQISAEVVIERDPQFILFPNYHGSEEFKGELLTERPLWREITAVKEDNVFRVSDDIISRPGPRLVDAVEEVFGILYP